MPAKSKSNKQAKSAMQMAEESALKAAILAKKVFDTDSNDDEGESDQEGDESSEGETATAAAKLSSKKRKVAAGKRIGRIEKTRRIACEEKSSCPCTHQKEH